MRLLRPLQQQKEEKESRKRRRWIKVDVGASSPSAFVYRVRSAVSFPLPFRSTHATIFLLFTPPLFFSPSLPPSLPSDVHYRAPLLDECQACLASLAQGAWKKRRLITDYPDPPSLPPSLPPSFPADVHHRAPLLDECRARLSSLAQGAWEDEIGRMEEREWRSDVNEEGRLEGRKGGREGREGHL